MKYKWHDFDNLETADQLTDYLDGREYTHGSYCHYTRLGIIDSILLHNTFQLSCVASFNDKIDAEQFEDSRRFYSLCFSTGINENLSLWYLYSGMQGHGGRIRFTSNSVKKLIQSSTYELWEYSPNDRTNAKMVCTLLPSDFRATFRDVLYTQDKSQKVTLKYNNMANYVVSSEELMKYKANSIGFTKSIVWYYEKETRFLIELQDHIVNLMNPGMQYYVAMRFSDAVKAMLFVGFAPEITSIKDEIIDYPHISQLSSRKLELSEYSGTVEMRLCDKCTHYQTLIKCKQNGCTSYSKK